MSHISASLVDFRFEFRDAAASSTNLYDAGDHGATSDSDSDGGSIINDDEVSLLIQAEHIQGGHITSLPNQGGSEIQAHVNALSINIGFYLHGVLYKIHPLLKSCSFELHVRNNNDIQTLALDMQEFRFSLWIDDLHSLNRVMDTMKNKFATPSPSNDPATTTTTTTTTTTRQIANIKIVGLYLDFVQAALSRVVSDAFTPVLLFRVTDVHLTALSSPPPPASSRLANLTFFSDAEFYNTRLGVWEPLVEKWGGEIFINDVNSTAIMAKVNLFSRINVNVSEDMLHLIAKMSTSSERKVRASTAAARKSTMNLTDDYLVSNDTGVTTYLSDLYQVGCAIPGKILVHVLDCWWLPSRHRVDPLPHVTCVLYPGEKVYEPISSSGSSDDDKPRFEIEYTGTSVDIFPLLRVNLGSAFDDATSSTNVVTADSCWGTIELAPLIVNNAGHDFPVNQWHKMYAVGSREATYELLLSMSFQSTTTPKQQAAEHLRAALVSQVRRTIGPGATPVSFKGVPNRWMRPFNGTSLLSASSSTIRRAELNFDLTTLPERMWHESNEGHAQNSSLDTYRALLPVDESGQFALLLSPFRHHDTTTTPTPNAPHASVGAEHVVLVKSAQRGTRKPILRISSPVTLYNDTGCVVETLICESRLVEQFTGRLLSKRRAHPKYESLWLLPHVHKGVEIRCSGNHLAHLGFGLANAFDGFFSTCWVDGGYGIQISSTRQNTNNNNDASSPPCKGSWISIRFDKPRNLAAIRLGFPTRLESVINSHTLDAKLHFTRPTGIVIRAKESHDMDSPYVQVLRVDQFDDSMMQDIDDESSCVDLFLDGEVGNCSEYLFEFLAPEMPPPSSANGNVVEPVLSEEMANSSFVRSFGRNEGNTQHQQEQQEPLDILLESGPQGNLAIGVSLFQMFQRHNVMRQSSTTGFVPTQRASNDFDRTQNQGMQWTCSLCDEINESGRYCQLCGEERGHKETTDQAARENDDLPAAQRVISGKLENSLWRGEVTVHYVTSQEMAASPTSESVPTWGSAASAIRLGGHTVSALRDLWGRTRMMTANGNGSNTSSAHKSAIVDVFPNLVVFYMGQETFTCVLFQDLSVAITTTDNPTVVTLSSYVLSRFGPLDKEEVQLRTSSAQQADTLKTALDLAISISSSSSTSTFPQQPVSNGNGGAATATSLPQSESYLFSRILTPGESYNIPVNFLILPPSASGGRKEASSRQYKNYALLVRTLQTDFISTFAVLYTNLSHDLSQVPCADVSWLTTQRTPLFDAPAESTNAFKSFVLTGHVDSSLMSKTLDHEGGTVVHDAKIYRHKIHISPWLVVQNALPYRLLFRIVDGFHPRVPEPFLEPGEERRFAAAERSSSLQIRIEGLTSWSDSFDIYKVDETQSLRAATTTNDMPHRHHRRHATVMVADDDSKTRQPPKKRETIRVHTRDEKLTFRLSVARETSPNGALRMIVYSEIWAYNYSDVPLALRPPTSFVGTKTPGRVPSSVAARGGGGGGDDDNDDDNRGNTNNLRFGRITGGGGRATEGQDWMLPPMFMEEMPVDQLVRRVVTTDVGTPTSSAAAMAVDVEVPPLRGRSGQQQPHHDMRNRLLPALIDLGGKALSTARIAALLTSVVDRNESAQYWQGLSTHVYWIVPPGTPPAGNDSMIQPVALHFLGKETSTAYALSSWKDLDLTQSGESSKSFDFSILHSMRRSIGIEIIRPPPPFDRTIQIVFRTRLVFINNLEFPIKVKSGGMAQRVRDAVKCFPGRCGIGCIRCHQPQQPQQPQHQHPQPVTAELTTAPSAMGGGGRDGGDGTDPPSFDFLNAIDFAFVEMFLPNAEDDTMRYAVPFHFARHGTSEFMFCACHPNSNFQQSGMSGALLAQTHGSSFHYVVSGGGGAGGRASNRNHVTNDIVEATSWSGNLDAKEENDRVVLLRGTDSSPDEGAMRVKVQVRISAATVFVVFSPDTPPRYEIDNQSSRFGVEIRQFDAPSITQNLILQPNSKCNIGLDEPMLPAKIEMRLVIKAGEEWAACCDWKMYALETVEEHEALVTTQSFVDALKDVIKPKRVLDGVKRLGGALLGHNNSPPQQQQQPQEGVTSDQDAFPQPGVRVPVDGVVSQSTLTLRLRNEAAMEPRRVVVDGNGGGDGAVDNPRTCYVGVKVISASLRTTRRFSNIKPHVVIALGGQRKSSKTSSGREPVWDDELSFEMDALPTSMFISVMDHGSGRFLGVAKVKLKPMVWDQEAWIAVNSDAWYQLKHQYKEKKKDKGKRTRDMLIAARKEKWLEEEEEEEEAEEREHEEQADRLNGVVTLVKNFTREGVMPTSAIIAGEEGGSLELGGIQGGGGMGMGDEDTTVGDEDRLRGGGARLPVTASAAAAAPERAQGVLAWFGADVAAVGTIVLHVRCWKDPGFVDTTRRKLTLRMSSLGLSLVHASIQREITYGLVQRVKMVLETIGEDVVHARGRVGRIQLDSYTVGSRFPIVFSPFELAGHEKGDMFSGDVVYFSLGPTLRYVESCSISFRKVMLSVEEKFVADVTPIFSVMVATRAKRKSREEKMVIVSLAKLHPIMSVPALRDATRMVYCDKLEVEPFVIALDLDLDGGAALGDDYYANVFKARAYIPTLESLGLVLNFNGVQKVNWFRTAHALERYFMRHYLIQAAQNWHRVLTSINYLGNPAQAGRRVFSGISQFFYQSAVGAQQGLTGFCCGVQAGVTVLFANVTTGVTESLHGVTSAMHGAFMYMNPTRGSNDVILNSLFQVVAVVRDVSRALAEGATEISQEVTDTDPNARLVRSRKGPRLFASDGSMLPYGRGYEFGDLEIMKERHAARRIARWYMALRKLRNEAQQQPGQPVSLQDKLNQATTEKKKWERAFGRDGTQRSHQKPNGGRCCDDKMKSWGCFCCVGCWECLGMVKEVYVKDHEGRVRRPGHPAPTTAAAPLDDDPHVDGSVAPVEDEYLMSR